MNNRGQYYPLASLMVLGDRNAGGLNHYYIHAVEASLHPERALPSADRLRTLAPAAGHLVHMSAHIYSRLGDHVAAARSNEQAISADEAYFKRHGPPFTGSIR